MRQSSMWYPQRGHRYTNQLLAITSSPRKLTFVLPPLVRPFNFGLTLLIEDRFFAFWRSLPILLFVLIAHLHEMRGWQDGGQGSCWKVCSWPENYSVPRRFINFSLVDVCSTPEVLKVGTATLPKHGIQLRV